MSLAWDSQKAQNTSTARPDAAAAASRAIRDLPMPGGPTTFTTPPFPSIVRFTSAGVLDTSLSKDGITDGQPIISDGMLVDGDGSVTLIGHKPMANNQVLARYTSSGDLATDPVTITGTKFMRGSPIERPDGSRYLYGSIASSLTTWSSPSPSRRSRGPASEGT